MSLYDELGVPKDADPTTIKRAHRKKVKQTHPDQETGDADAFRKVQQAYLVLSDPERRKRYDETGDAGEATSHSRSPEEQEYDEALQALGGLVVQLLNEADSALDYEDMQKRLGRVVIQNAAGMASDKSKTKAAISKAERMAKRWKRKSGAEGPDMIQSMLGAQIATLYARVSQIERAERINAKVKEIVESYEYKFDKPKTPDATMAMYQQIAREELTAIDPFASPMFDKMNRRR